MVSRGLEMAARLFVIVDHQTLVDEMQRCLTYALNLDYPMRRAIGMEAQVNRRPTLVNAHREEADRRKDPMEFVGDIGGPPLGWVLLFGGAYTNVYGGFVPEVVRRWGYVMWDESRWIGLGAKDLVSQQWEMMLTIVQNSEEDYEWSSQVSESPES